MRGFSLRSFTHADHRALHRRHQLSISVSRDGKNIGAHHGQRLSRFDDFRARDERFALRRAQQVHLKLDAQNFRARRHQSVGSVTAGGVGDGRDDAGVQVAPVAGLGRRDTAA